MGVYKTTWAGPVFVEAMRFWFYSLVAGILLSVVGIWELYTTPLTVRIAGEKGKGREVKNEEAKKEWNKERAQLIKCLVIDGCDLFIPGSVTGWLPVSSQTVGYCSVISTVLAGSDVWVKIQEQGS